MTTWGSLATRAVVGLCCGIAVGYAFETWHVRSVVSTAPQASAGEHTRGPRGMVWVPGGRFLMGSSGPASRSNEGPAHWVQLHGFWMDRTPVTNAQFEAFVAATHYVTTAETPPDWDTLKAQLPPDSPRPPATLLVPGAMVFVGTDREVNLDDFSQWWNYVPGANWRHPQGPDSSIEGKAEHPVVQVSYEDARHYALWAGKRLATEAEWEFAARGGLQQATYVWGNELNPSGRRMANIWPDASPAFPIVNAKMKVSIGTSVVCSFLPNGYGLCDMTGNAWQWVSDWYRADAFSETQRPATAIDPQGPTDSYDPDEPGVPAHAPKRVIRGGSFLCSASYCASYRPSARRGNDPYTSMSHIGFRLALDPAGAG